MSTITTKSIVQINFPESQFKKVITDKNQITLHHTVSGDNAQGVADWWKSNPERVATCIIIEKSGVPFQCYSSQYYGYHLGVKAATFKKYNLEYKLLDMYSIGVELCSWGGLVKRGDKFYNAYAGEVKAKDVIEMDYRGYKYFDKYSDAQINTLKELLIYWGKTYDIPLDYSEDMWEFNLDALKGVPGIYSHTSYREDKSDLYPDPRIIEMLKSLKK